MSAAVSQLFDSHAQEYQALSAQAAAFHEQFVDLVNAGGAAYAGAEAANATAMAAAVTEAVTEAPNEAPNEAATHDAHALFQGEIDQSTI